jgi:glycosyltransferase involved in cell wall biosynthesis
MGVTDVAPIPVVPGRGQVGARPRETLIEPAVSVVIPTLNEAANVGWVLQRLPAVVDEVIVVDGLSTDGTVAAARAARPDVVIVNATRRGKGAALRAGFAAARGTFVVMLDADCSMDPAEIDRYVALLERGVDLVKGSRFLPDAGTADITVLRRWGNGTLLALVNHLYGARFTDLCYGFIAFRRSVLDALRVEADGFEVETEIAVHALCAGMRIAEVPSFESRRRDGVSKLHPCRDGSRVLWTIAREHRAMRRATRERALGRGPLAPANGVVAVTAGIGSGDADD